MIYCSDGNCMGYADKRYCGLCPKCWIRLTDEQRDTLRGKAAEETRVVTYRIPAYPGTVKRTLAWVIGGPVATIGVMLLLKKFGVL